MPRHLGPARQALCCRPSGHHRCVLGPVRRGPRALQGSRRGARCAVGPGRTGEPEQAPPEKPWALGRAAGAGSGGANSSGMYPCEW